MIDIENFSKKVFAKMGKHLTLIKILLLYRYFSFLITLILFYTTTPQINKANKIGIIAGLIIAYTSMAFLYLKIQKDKKQILILSIIETIENSIFLIISGGFSSPFIWYFISTAFITAVNVSYLLAYLFSAVYFITAALSTMFVLRSVHNFDVVRLYLNTAISCIIVVIVILQLIRYAIKIEEKSKSLSVMNDELEEAKVKVEKTLKYSIEIYETINLFHLYKDDNILQELAKHFLYLTGLEQMIFIRLTPEEKYGTYVSNGFSADEVDHVYKKSLELIENNLDNSGRESDYVGSKILSVNYVMYEENICGAFVTLSDEAWELKQSVSDIPENIHREDILSQMNGAIDVFMKLVGIILKKMEIDEIEEQLLVSEEQNRIANEIHDIVLQKLFAISCKLYVLALSKKNTSEKKLQEELYGIKESIDMTVKELREAIYNYSWDKMGEDTFKSKLIQYTDELQNMQNVEISLSILGDTQKVKANQKRDLYRIICEAMNNAVRHGKAKHIEVNISIEEDSVNIRIVDDGEGFDLEKYQLNNDKGLGINNIYRIVDMLHGHIDIGTNDSNGTVLHMAIPFRTAA